MLRFAALVALVVAAPSSAFAYCFEPSAPYCASTYMEFSDEYEFDRCKREMETYASEVETFTQCRQDEVQELADTAEEEARQARQAADEYESEAQDASGDIDRAVSDYNDAVQAFNRRAGG